MSSILSFYAESDSLEATELLGEVLGGCLRAPCVLSLDGDLGAGKTSFTRGLVDGVQQGEGDFVSSPTYAVCNAYETEPPVHHYDLYRLASEDDLESVGFRDSLDDAIVIVEWPTQVASVASLVDIEVQIRVLSETSRRLTVKSTSSRGAEMLEALEGAMWKTHV